MKEEDILKVLETVKEFYNSSDSYYYQSKEHGIVGQAKYTSYLDGAGIWSEIQTDTKSLAEAIYSIMSGDRSKCYDGSLEAIKE